MKTVFIPSRFPPQNPLKAKKKLSCNIIEFHSESKSKHSVLVYFNIEWDFFRLFCPQCIAVMEVWFIRLSLCTKSKRLRVLLKDVCLLWVLLKRRIELYPPRCPFSAFRIFWTAHWDRKCRFSTFQCLDWTFSFFDVLTYELRLQWLQQPTFNRHEPLILDWKYKGGGRRRNKSC